MIGSTRQVSVYAFGGPVDLRKGFDGLSALVTQGLHRDPLSGDLFAFVSRTRSRGRNACGAATFGAGGGADGLSCGGP